jgi:YHS domain-containing protein
MRYGIMLTIALAFVLMWTLPLDATSCGKVHSTCKGGAHDASEKISSETQMTGADTEMQAEEVGTIEKPGWPQTLCPVMDGAVNRELYIDYEGKRIYFCCQSCKGKFEKNPTEYLKKMADKGVVLEDSPVLQTQCPIMDGEVDREIYTDHEGKRVYFCCKPCKDVFEKDPDKYMKKMMDEGIMPESIPMTQETEGKS